MQVIGLKILPLFYKCRKCKKDCKGFQKTCGGSKVGCSTILNRYVGMHFHKICGGCQHEWIEFISENLKEFYEREGREPLDVLKDAVNSTDDQLVAALRGNREVREILADIGFELVQE